MLFSSLEIFSGIMILQNRNVYSTLGFDQQRKETNACVICIYLKQAKESYLQYYCHHESSQASSKYLKTLLLFDFKLCHTHWPEFTKEVCQQT